ncbi:hypothetical protein LY78DRAFT_380940 [Colletotrichum sublineola]|nr:hypothetical protein LY78DRAFT_380940 [Colletotrichum sublineola]
MQQRPNSSPVFPLSRSPSLLENSSPRRSLAYSAPSHSHRWISNVFSGDQRHVGPTASPANNYIHRCSQSAFDSLSVSRQSPPHPSCCRTPSGLPRSSPRPSRPWRPPSMPRARRRARRIPAALTGPRQKPGPASMNPLGADSCDRLLRELSAIPTSPSTTRAGAPPSRPGGAPTSCTLPTPSPPCGPTSAMTPAFLTRLMCAALTDTLRSSSTPPRQSTSSSASISVGNMLSLSLARAR